MSRCNRRFILRSACFFYFGMCSLYLLGQTSAPVGAALPSAAQDSKSSPSFSGPADSNVTLGVGDLIEINVFGVPDLSTKTRVSGTGDVYLPLIDYVHVAGLSSDEAQTLIQKRLEDGGFVRAPHVSIFVGESASQSITLMGEVMRPGPYAAIGAADKGDCTFE